MLKPLALCHGHHSLPLCPRREQTAILYQNISLTEPRLVPQYERGIMHSPRHIKIHTTAQTHLYRARDSTSTRATGGKTPHPRGARTPPHPHTHTHTHTPTPAHAHTHTHRKYA